MVDHGNEAGGDSAASHEDDHYGDGQLCFLRPMAQLIEFRCLKGKVLLSTMELHKSQQYPEARALQAAIYTYLSGENFELAEELTEEELSTLVRG